MTNDKGPPMPDSPYDPQAIHAIKQLKYRYLRTLDTKKWDELAGCLTEDATAAYSGGKYSYEGREAIMGFLTDSLGRGSILTMHQVHQPEIEITGDETATGVWALEDKVIDLQFNITITGAAFYRDEYVKQDGEWKIKSTGYERVFEEIDSRADKPALKLMSSMFDGAAAE